MNISEETTIVTKDKKAESHFFSVSIRGIIVLSFCWTCCIMQWAGKKVEEPLYSLVLLTAGHYFGSNEKPKSQVK
jgi:hypothetical protein